MEESTSTHSPHRDTASHMAVKSNIHTFLTTEDSQRSRKRSEVAPRAPFNLHYSGESLRPSLEHNSHSAVPSLAPLSLSVIRPLITNQADDEKNKLFKENLAGNAHEMQLTTIGQIPEQVLERIFMYLDTVELGHCSRVCVGWNAIIRTGTLPVELDLLAIRKV